jgi:hypothetical protein
VEDAIERFYFLAKVNARSSKLTLARHCLMKPARKTPHQVTHVVWMQAGVRDPITAAMRSSEMNHSLSPDDRRFSEDFAAGRIAIGAFDHRAHIRLAYTLLAEHDTETALALMRAALLGFIRRNNVPVAKYHETLTRAWILAVRHFMAISPAAESAADFVGRNPRMLDAKIMLTHYSAEVLFSEEARARFVEPDLERIPRHDAEVS